MPKGPGYRRHGSTNRPMRRHEPGRRDPRPVIAQPMSELGPPETLEEILRRLVKKVTGEK